MAIGGAIAWSTCPTIAVQAAVAEATDAWGALHIAVNCAGILGPSKTLSNRQTFPPELWNRVIGINLTGTFNVVRHAALAMTANEPSAEGERGVIVNTASGAAAGRARWAGGLQREQGRRHRPDAARGTRPAAHGIPRHGHRAGAVRDRHVRRDADEGAAAPDRPDHPVPDAHGPGRRSSPGWFRHIVENAYLNATTISIDAGTRGHR